MAASQPKRSIKPVFIDINSLEQLLFIHRYFWRIEIKFKLGILPKNAIGFLQQQGKSEYLMENPLVKG
jgi:hypothetical protein